jgi:hypothetical protein
MRPAGKSPSCGGGLAQLCFPNDAHRKIILARSRRAIAIGLARFIVEVVDGLDSGRLESAYAGRGCAAYMVAPRPQWGNRAEALPSDGQSTQFRPKTTCIPTFKVSSTRNVKVASLMARLPCIANAVQSNANSTRPESGGKVIAHAGFVQKGPIRSPGGVVARVTVLSPGVTDF